MYRYHKSIYFPQQHTSALNKLNNKLNSMNFDYSSHCLDRIRYRFINTREALNFINRLHLEAKNIFEYYIENNIITKLCYRIHYNNICDIILILNNNKKNNYHIY